MKTTPNVFSNNDITVSYNPCQCIHAQRCAKELSNVFRQSIIPWIDLDGESNEKIINQVKKCPSGALQFHTTQEVA